jgi:hypothetical protein
MDLETEAAPVVVATRGRQEQGTETSAVIESTWVTTGWRGRARRMVRVGCPFCRASHVHAWPLGWAEPGERQALCRRGSYRVVDGDA